MASPQTDKGFIRVANELYEEILRRDFSKRQQNMLLFIMRLSYGCGRKECEIPKYNYFEIIGLYKGDIKKELKYLRTCKVIDYNEDSMIFSINKNYDIWQLSPSKNYDKDRLNELIALNLKGKQVSKTLTLEETSPVEVEPKKVSETLTNNVIDEDALVSKILTKLGLNVSETLTNKLVKHELSESATPTESKLDRLPKDIIKDNIKDNKKNSSFDNEAFDSVFENFWNLYNKKTGKAKTKQKIMSLVKKNKVTFDEIITGVERYNAHLAITGLYKKDPLTFINGEHWQDEYSTEGQAKTFPKQPNKQTKPKRDFTKLKGENKNES